MSKKVVITWTDPSDDPTAPGSATVNINREYGRRLGLTNLNLNSPGLLWKYSDTGETPPGGETWNIEGEIDAAVTPRDAGGVLRQYTDFGPPFVQDPTLVDPYSKTDRIENHILEPLLNLGVAGGRGYPEVQGYDEGGATGMKEGETLWLGWSEKYAHLDHSRTCSVLQFMTLTKGTKLDLWGVNQAPWNESQYVDGGPPVAIQHRPVGGASHFAVEMRTGTPASYTVREYTHPDPIVLERWYDFIVQYTYSNTAGRLRVWLYDTTVTDPSTYSVTDTPWIDDTGNTDYGGGPPPPSHLESTSSLELRWGAYRYGCKLDPPLTPADYYVEKHTGQAKLLYQDVAASSGFSSVQPMQEPNLLTDSFNTAALTLTNPQNTPEPDGATLTIDSNSDQGTLYSYSKTTAFTGTEAEKAAEIIANGVGQAPVVGTNTRVVTGQDGMTDHYAGWVQDSEGFGGDMVLVFNMGAGETLTIPGGAGTYLFDIDWGDGTPVETGLTTEGAGPHTYTDANPEAVVRIRGVFPHLYFNNGGDKDKLTKVLQLGDVGLDSCNRSFFGCSNMTSFTAGVTDTSASPSFHSFLRSCTGLVTPPDLRGINTSSATTLYTFLSGLANMVGAPDVSGLDTSQVTTFYAGLSDWDNAGIIDLALDVWNVETGVDFTNFLRGAQLTTACYDRTLASWGNQTLAAGALSTTIHFGTSQYTDAASHALLLAQVTNIIDGGLAP